ncbi:unnamed protein product [Bursaphelenchus xylophilus]|uniref:(pine wood nematode) hypothetical protein n=1 Tax=Bursaphelenchus xylophilus TaxID=6326 RepID=A0A1I7RY58_BURXY|nr:unnamed protein product [Bursaphelenchus xylophilus]CAG9085328.1 unnamed protein product [Bursaphelenchus xylophilus]
MSLNCHQRNASAAEQLIRVEESQNDNPQDPVYSSPNTVELGVSGPTNEVMFSNFSDCSSYYGLPNSQNENETRYLFKNPYLRANVRVVIGSIILTIVGFALISFGVLVTFVPNEMDVHGWIFFVVGMLFFIPGFYHIVYITCTLCGREGYAFDNLPTFTKPTT